MLLPLFIACAVVLRLGALWISRRNEARLRAAGAREYGAGNTRALALAHVAFYLLAIGEGLWRGAPVTGVSLFGMALYAAAMLVLAHVIQQLGQFWTVKLFIAPDHALVTSPLFRLVRHPNYFLNMIPELLGLALALQAWSTLVLGLPVYLVILARRIRLEEAAMRDRFAGY